MKTVTDTIDNIRLALLEIVATSAPEVWVLNPKLLSASIEREPVGLKTEDVAVGAARIVKEMQKV